MGPGSCSCSNNQTKLADIVHKIQCFDTNNGPLILPIRCPCNRYIWTISLIPQYTSMCTYVCVSICVCAKEYSVCVVERGGGGLWDPMTHVVMTMVYLAQPKAHFLFLPLLPLVQSPSLSVCNHPPPSLLHIAGWPPAYYTQSG